MEPVLFLISLGLFASAFSAHQEAYETARVLGRGLCTERNLQWLDTSVYQTRVRFARNSSGRLGLIRTFRFDFSENGANRLTGSLSLQGGKLISFDLPQPPPLPASENEQQ